MLFFVLFAATFAKGQAQGNWWWGTVPKGTEILRLNLTLDPRLESAQVGERFAPRCFPGRVGFRRPNDYVARVSESFLKIRRKRVDCINGAADVETWHSIMRFQSELRLEALEVVDSRTRGKVATDDLSEGNILRFEETTECFKKGLSHQLANLEFAVQLAWFFGATLEVGKVHENTAHTHCDTTRMSKAGFATQKAIYSSGTWSTLVNLSNTPIEEREINLSSIEVKEILISYAALLRMQRAQLGPRTTRGGMTRVILLKESKKDFPWCNHYMRSVTMAGYFLPWSRAVLNAADDIIKFILLRSSKASTGDPLFDAVHVRAGDKVTDSKQKRKGGNAVSPYLRLARLDSDELFKRLYAFLGGGSEGGGVYRNNPSALYIATDASPLMLTRGRGAIAILHYWPGMVYHGSGGVRSILSRHCPVRGLYDACVKKTTASTIMGNPYFTLAVEMAILERARVFISSERSNPSRRVALVRLQRQSGTKKQQKEAMIVRYLQSSLVIRLLATDIGLAEWERASIRSNEEAVATLDEKASLQAAKLYDEAKSILGRPALKDWDGQGDGDGRRRCLHAAEWGLAKSMKSVVMPNGESAQQKMASVDACCYWCAQINDIGLNCSAWQWSPRSGHCSLRTGEIEIEKQNSNEGISDNRIASKICGFVR